MPIAWGNALNSTLQTVVDLSGQTNLVLHLTGSRFFGTANRFSDWDFFVQYCSGIDDELRGLGFIPADGEGSYNDALTVSVWKYNFTGVSIHIQVCTNVKMKQIAQKILYQTGVLKIVRDKYEQRRIWKNLISLLVCGFGSNAEFLYDFYKRIEKE